ncbi:ankyrin repeat domain-containing protein SOWAHB [Heterodontus francisci]|uniref:ankyrin repeat domain-containing protein SOWAHB n=1 Tax=Heterodontus francisci TaxID=7792 RepID=UPI00355B8E28
MATEFSLNAVWQFLLARGGKVKSAELLEHFTIFLNNPNTKANARGLFKEFVNKLGLVVQEDGVKYICLKKKYRGQINGSEAAAGGRGHGSKGDDGAGGGMENGDKHCGAIDIGSSARKQSAGGGALTDSSKSVLSPPDVDNGCLDNSCLEECNENNQAVPMDRRSAQEDGRVARHSHTIGTNEHVSSSNKNLLVSDIKIERGNQVQTEHYRTTKLVTEPFQLITDLGETLPNQDYNKGVQSAKKGGDLLPDAFILSNISNPDNRKSTVSTAKQMPESPKNENVGSAEHDIKSKDDKLLFASKCNFSPTQVKTSPDINLRRSSRKRLQRSLAVNRSSSHCDDGNTVENSTDASSPNSESLLYTPRSSRKNFRELMISSSPQLRHSVVYNNPVAFPNIKQGDSGSSKNESDSSSLTSSKLDDEDTGSVALDPLEHEWMVHASEGRWDSLEALLAADPTLITWKDFVTGFTCIHWAAKHGKPELLAMLVNYAGKHDIPININIRSSGGYTPLHLAAMHGHTEVVKLLTGAYDADVDIRDYSGKKAWQYLGQEISEELRNLIGASRNSDPENTLQNESGRWRLSKVLPTNLTHKLANALEEETYYDGAPAKAVSRKNSTKKTKLNRIRFKTQIIHTTPSLRGTGDQRDPKSVLKLRPKSNIFG